MAYCFTATATGAGRQSQSVSNSQQGVVGRADHSPTMEKWEQQIMSYIYMESTCNKNCTMLAPIMVNIALALFRRMLILCLA